MRQKRTRKLSRGFSLLEVLLSIAILGGSMVVIGHGFYNGYRSVRNARMVGLANRFADSAMSELAAGAIEPQSSTQAVPDHPGWSVSIEVESASIPGLLSAQVVAENSEFRPQISVSIARLIPDPNYDPLAGQERQ